MGKIRSVLKKVLLGVGIALGVIILVVGGYFAYVFITYNRIDDNQPAQTVNNSSLKQLPLDKTYTIVSQNMGFGAYIPDFTFFMDGGKESRGRSEKAVKEAVDLGVKTLLSFNPDFILCQEVDTSSTRSYHLNQVNQIFDSLPGWDSAFAVNYHSAYLMYPVLKPHGASNSGIVTYSKYAIEEALRRRLEITDGFSKVIDLDRCYSWSRLKVENGRDLVIFNVHLSAYAADANIKNNQLKKLFGDMKAEYDKGNYVVCGGDFNSDFTGSSVAQLNSYDKNMSWTQPFSDELIPAGIKKCVNYSDGKVTPSARDVDIPYGPDCFVLIVDGFFVSENVDVEFLQNVDCGFAYSDHQPVVMKFRLQ